MADNPLVAFRADLERYKPAFENMLPPNIKPEKFVSALMTAVTHNPDLIKADRQSVLVACMKAAADGLVPDGREGAIVIYNTKTTVDGKDVWVKGAQWMPMLQGVIKRMRNSGELSSLRAHAVYEKDDFTYSLGDEEHIHHIPYNGKDDPGEINAAYAIAILNNGEIIREVVLRRDIAKARAASKSPNGPAWQNWGDEMSRKFAVHRISKYVPNSTEDAAWLAGHLSDPEDMKDITPTEAPARSSLAQELIGMATEQPMVQPTISPTEATVEVQATRAPRQTRAPETLAPETEAPAETSEPELDPKLVANAIADALARMPAIQTSKGVDNFVSTLPDVVVNNAQFWAAYQSHAGALRKIGK